MNNTRRNFIRNAGVAVTAAVTGGSATAAPADDLAGLQMKLGMLEDSVAIRALTERYFALLQQQSTAELAGLFAAEAVAAHDARVLSISLVNASIEIARDRQSASAQLRSHVQFGTPMSGNGTLQQMARQQGVSEQQWSEAGIYFADYVKQGTEWKIAALQFQKS